MRCNFLKRSSNTSEFVLSDTDFINQLTHTHTQINLKLLRVNGQFKVFHFSPSTSAAVIAKHVFDNWPEGKYFNAAAPSAMSSIEIVKANSAGQQQQ